MIRIKLNKKNKNMKKKSNKKKKKTTQLSSKLIHYGRIK